MTLVEIMISAAIATIVMTVALRFVIQTLKSYQYETGKLMINRDIRKFTAQMMDDGTYANGFMIFDQASNLNRATSSLANGAAGSATYGGYTTDLVTTDPADPVDATAPGTSKVESGMPGDVLVFIYYVSGDNSKISQLIMYYRWISTTPNGSNGTNDTTVTNRTTALKRWVLPIAAAQQSAGIMKLLPIITATSPSTTLFPYVDGQANDVVPTGTINRRNKLFYNSNNNSVLIRGRIYENYTAQRLIKSTYTFTITPRG
jgi:hypothetical protein